MFNATRSKINENQHIFGKVDDGLIGFVIDRPIWDVVAFFCDPYNEDTKRNYVEKNMTDARQLWR